MTLRRSQKIPSTRAACAVLVLVVSLGSLAPAAEDGSIAPAGPGGTIEPLFAFLLDVANGDSLGSWTGSRIRDYAAGLDRPSRFPLDQLVMIERRRPTGQESARWPGGELRAVWALQLVTSLDRPMPYSILGYHPGSLRVSGRLVLSELELGDHTFLPEEDGEMRPHRLMGLKALRLDQGSLVLDADAVPDAILGGNLDDAWTLGFALAREGDRQVGLAVSIKRDGDPIFGEFDFARDRIMKSGSPLGSQVSRFCRGWFTQPESQPPPTWVEVP